MHAAKISLKHLEGKHTAYNLYCIIITIINIDVHNSNKYIIYLYKLHDTKSSEKGWHEHILTLPAANSPLFFRRVLAAVHANSIRPFQKQLTLLSRLLLLPPTVVSQRKAGSTTREILLKGTSSTIFPTHQSIRYIDVKWTYKMHTPIKSYIYTYINMVA